LNQAISITCIFVVIKTLLLQYNYAEIMLKR
jgi:hypothetical protein